MINSKTSNKLKRYFNIDRLEHALFYNWQYGLRFELNTGGSSVEMFASAYNRARELLQYTFDDSGTIYALVISYVYARDRLKKHKEMRRLERCGFNLPEIYKSAHFIELEKRELSYQKYILPV